MNSILMKLLLLALGFFCGVLLCESVLNDALTDVMNSNYKRG